MELARLYPALADLLAEVEASIRRVWEGDSRFLRDAARRVLSGRGKRLRPSIVLLAAECAGGATEASIAIASVVEVAHAASLVHDDVVDDADYRRGRDSAKAVWGNKVSVLLGDYLIARAFHLLPEGERERVLPQVAAMARQMCEGQVQELQAAHRRLREAEYLEIVRAKTGSLFGFCGRAGVETAGGPPAMAAALEKFGERFGVAFQMADDILDLVGSNGRSGKPAGRDLAEGKLTLPLLLAAERGGRETWAALERLLKMDKMTARDVQDALDIAESTGGVEFAWARVREWLAAAREQLAEVPASDAKEALLAAAGKRFPMPVMSSQR
jgi:octaprenyl-diphosphate synthase